MDHNFMFYFPWILFHIIVLALLLFDLLFLHKNPREINFREALFWSGVYVALALLFNFGILMTKGHTPAVEFLTGYLIEISLSIDNLFVFLTIFTIFNVPRVYQHRVLFWGILGAVVMRAIFIFAGVALVNSFSWMVYLFGAILVFTGVKLFFQKGDENPDIKNYWPVKLAKRFFPFTDTYHEGKFVIREKGRMLGTPLLLVLIVIDIVDIIFAVDSVPAIIAVTRDTFIVYTSNIFAILGLRSMYFALAGLMPLFCYLKYGISFILIFIGVKLGISNFYHFSTAVSLGVIGLSISLSILASKIFPPKR